VVLLQQLGTRAFQQNTERKETETIPSHKVCKNKIETNENSIIASQTIREGQNKQTLINGIGKP
jgi:hypothetical protein